MSDIITANKFYYIVKNEPDNNGVLILPSEYLLQLPKDKAIHELKQNILYFQQISSGAETDIEAPKNITEKIQLELSIFEAFLSQLTMDSDFTQLKYLEFAHDEIDWLNICEEILGKDVLENATNQVLNDLIQDEDAVAFFDRGSELFDKKLYQDATISFTKAIQMKSDFLEAHYWLGQSYGELGEYDKELEAYLCIVDIDPSNAEAYNGIGLVLIEKEDFKKAVDAFVMAKQIDPSLISSHFGLAIAYWELGDKDEALQEYEILTKLDKNTANKFLKMYQVSDRGK